MEKNIKRFNDFIKESKTYKISNINYELDGEDGSDLPEEFTIEIPADMDDSAEIADFVGNKISDETGFLHTSFDMDEVE